MSSTSRQAFYRAWSALRVGLVVSLVLASLVGGVGAVVVFVWGGVSGSLLGGRGSVGLDAWAVMAAGFAGCVSVGLVASLISAMRAYRYSYSGPVARNIPVTRFVLQPPDGDAG